MQRTLGFCSDGAGRLSAPMLLSRIRRIHGIAAARRSAEWALRARFPFRPGGRRSSNMSALCLFAVSGTCSPANESPGDVIYSPERSQPMEPTKSKLPKEAIQLYNLFIHGEISRRAFMDGVQKFAIGGLTAATIVQALMPNYALGPQVSKTDDRIKATYETVPSPQGNGGI